jgi:hypothetical protein
MAREPLFWNGYYDVFLFILPRHRWGDNIKIDIQENSLDCIDLTQDRD